jgi:hypothetical protein
MGCQTLRGCLESIRWHSPTMNNPPLVSLVQAKSPCPHPARTSGSGSPLSCRFFIPGEPRNKNAAPKLGRGVGGEGKVDLENTLLDSQALSIQNPKSKIQNAITNNLRH